MAKQKPLKRNPYAFDPIMKKGGVHEKTTKAKRRKDKMAWRKEARKCEPFFMAAKWLSAC
ncbi:hypothetical protein [Reinekea marinisedimentorum]|uniref:Uncharacterized protein n=1 Tax=Reinekea marinisedimentorum TaxID=230495 RepID=A0A4R3IC09_9GAMM|nr:hypothetical protein [Reinekea marinisedimentorum]TCS44041.1 hypothetical protein BCF53_101384 [Reinekea marinisedimentorum]